MEDLSGDCFEVSIHYSAALARASAATSRVSRLFAMPSVNLTLFRRDVDSDREFEGSSSGDGERSAGGT